MSGKTPLTAEPPDSLLRQGRYEEASRGYLDRLRQASDDVEAWLGLVRARLALGHVEKAKDTLASLLTLAPEHSEARSHRAMIALQEGDERALETLRALAEAPSAGLVERLNHALALVERRPSAPELEAAIARVAELAPEHPHVALMQGRVALAKGDYDAAHERLHEAARRAPQATAPIQWLARLHAARGDFGLAMHTLTRAIEKAPAHPPLYEDLYRLCVQAGSPKGAVRAATALVGFDPKSALYARDLGAAQLAAGDVPAARRSLERALSLAPGAAEVQRPLAHVLSLQGERAQAKALLEASVAGHPNLPGPALDLAGLYEDSEGEVPRARALLESVVAAHPHNGAARLQLAKVMARLGRADDAATHARVAMEVGDADVRAQAEALLRPT
jgi:tetratricopeptide (TPR) repeat protein